MQNLVLEQRDNPIKQTAVNAVRGEKGGDSNGYGSICIDRCY